MVFHRETGEGLGLSHAAFANRGIIHNKFVSLKIPVFGCPQLHFSDVNKEQVVVVVGREDLLGFQTGLCGAKHLNQCEHHQYRASPLIIFCSAWRLWGNSGLSQALALSPLPQEGFFPLAFRLAIHRNFSFIFHNA